MITNMKLLYRKGWYPGTLVKTTENMGGNYLRKSWGEFAERQRTHH